MTSWPRCVLVVLAFKCSYGQRYLHQFFLRLTFPPNALLSQQVEMDPRLFSLADEQLFPDLRGQLGASLDQLERYAKTLE